MSHIYDTPLHNGTDAYLNDLACQYQEDPDALPLTSPAPPTTETALEILAALARTCVATSHEGAAAEAGYVQDRDHKEVLITFPDPGYARP